MSKAALQHLIPDAPDNLCVLLDGAQGLIEPPIRSEIFGLQRFAQHGRSLGETHRAAPARFGAPGFFPRLRSNVLMLQQAHAYIGMQARSGYDISPAAEWLLDNFHLIEAQLEQIHDGLPRSYFRGLPVLLDAPLAGLPRVYGIAWAFVAHTDGAFDEDLLLRFLSAYQETRELSLAEMWALPTTLRVLLIENLRRLAERVACNKAAREVANLCCDRIQDYPVHTLDQVLALLHVRGMQRVFLAQMAQRLQEPASAANGKSVPAQQDWLSAQLPDLAQLQAQQAADQTADNLSVSNAVRSLRAISEADWPDIICHASVLMRLMLTAPVFEAEDGCTRDQTLHAIEALSKRSRQSELTVARTLIALMQSGIGPDGAISANAVAHHWLQGAGRPAMLKALGLHERFERLAQVAARRLVLPIYLGSLLLGTAGLVAWMLIHHAPSLATEPAWMTVLLVILMLFPASETVIAVVNRLISESTRPQQLPRLALANGIEREHRVLVAVPAMLTDAAAIQKLTRRLLLHHLANPETHVQFALLSDWVDARTQHLFADQSLLTLARHQIEALNRSYPTEAGEAPRFLLLHRPRQYSDSEQAWIGWERKRGKLQQLVQALATGDRSAFADLGACSQLADAIPYVLTLDSDTQLPPGRLRELVGVALHPQNQPVLGVDGASVVSGYGVLQPRIGTPLPGRAQATWYHWLFAGQCGVDPYSAATSEVYQDLFGEGSFTGKGLLNVRAMHAVLHGRLPEGQVLSHDLLEGSLARCASVSDVTLLEDAPFHADVAASRVHRWTRGDWQLLPILLQPERYSLRAINRWKMLDNLRRSLVAPMSLAMLLASLAGIGLAPLAALGLVLVALTAGPLMGALAGFSPHRRDLAKRRFYGLAGLDLLRAMAGGIWLTAQLLQQALMSVDAIVRALYRSVVSHRRLLQWTTAETAQARAATGAWALLRLHWSEPVVAAVLLAAVLLVGSPTPMLALALAGLWALAPLSTWWVSRPRPLAGGATLNREDQVFLAGVARDTWRLFERCVGPDDHFLPPDNLQVMPHDMVAHRTSPTNIGLYLLSVACARQFGWIGTQEMLTRLEATLTTMQGLQRHCGHFLNWYDTQTLAPLLPMYVSTVDSGNLAGHLLAVAQACRERALAPHDGAALHAAIAASRERMAPLLALGSQITPDGSEQLGWLMADHKATLRSAEMDARVRDVSHGAGTMDASRRLLALAGHFEQMAWDADLHFLYHRKRHLFHIGYRVAEQQLDAGFYDLMASESRLTSLLAIAKGDVPVRHWQALGRPFYAVGMQVGLRSWSGSMFEYLMPTLVLAEPQGSALNDACRAAVVEQIAFMRGQQRPWGMSESAYAASDHTLAYQYAPQGVPRLALRRTPVDEMVVAPYATVLAAQVAPQRATANLHLLQGLGARQCYGFIEALDYSPARQAAGGPFTPVATFMTHHEGMSIVALANVLLNGVAQRWGMANAHIEAVTALLHERAPREVSMLYAPRSGPPPQSLQRRAPGLLREVLPGMAAVEPTHLLSNGRYCVALRANGAGFSRWGTTGITRWRDDALRDEYGSFFYLRWDQQPQLVSITQHPAPDPAAHYQSIYHADRVCFDAAWPNLQAHTTVWVSPEDDIEFRQVELRNLSDRTLEIELISAFEVTLNSAGADESHPAFANMFARAEWQPGEQALLFERRPRLENEAGMHAIHFIAESDPQVVAVRCQTDRLKWRGRNHPASRPLGSFDVVPTPDFEPGAPQVTGLDPVCALSVRLRIAPKGKAQLTFATAASDHAATLLAVLDKHRQASHVQRASLMSATLGSIRLRGLNISAEQFAAIQALTTPLLLTLTRPGLAAVGANSAVTPVCDRRLLWRYGISGDRPILLVTAGVVQGVGLLRSLVQALRWWNFNGLACDLVVVNGELASYEMPLQRELVALRERYASDTQVGEAAPATQTQLHVLRADELTGDEKSSLQALARLTLTADGRPLLRHVQEWLAQHEQAFEERQQLSTTALQVLAAFSNAVPAPTGEFASATGEFRFDVSSKLRPPRPWINVLSNSSFGAQISETGAGYTWAVNSRLNQLTMWSNDPVCDPPAEWFLLQDRKTMQTWSVAPSAWGDPGQAYRVAHGQGYSQIRHRRGDLEVTASWCVDAHSSVKQVRVRLVNRGHRSVQLRLVGIAEWMMGANRTDRGSVRSVCWRQTLDGSAEKSGTAVWLTGLLATQTDGSAGFGGGTAFFAMAGMPGQPSDAADWTCDRRECFDARGALVLPDHFGQKSGAGLDPCAALSVNLTVNPGEPVERVFLLGYGASAGLAMALAAAAAQVPAAQRIEQVRDDWDRLLAATVVKTPDPLFDVMVNRWLLYQTVSCRLWAKAGFYQAGGATGFRDQLQDAMALAWAAPGLLREQIVLCASRQFEQGDVQHWWHAPLGAGVRTHFSDDLLWLPYALLHYLRATGDSAVLDQLVPFIAGAAIPTGAEDAYFVPTVTDRQANVYEHAARTIDRSLDVGVHGLPLMGSGDWNDGMNRVGIQGRGESVWLGWFLCQLVADFAPVAYGRGDAPRALKWEAAARGWKAALLGAGWDGKWFKRAFFDNGQPLGSSQNPEAKIDLIAQAWAVLSGVAPVGMQSMAMHAVQDNLEDRQAGLIRLLDPPLANALPSAGYIQAYPPGIRENGGQYAHAGVWALMAQAALATATPGGSGDRAYEYFTWLSPAHRASHPTQGKVYALEPYVMAGDVYSQPPYVGRGGWSWYTGAAAWLHRAAVESILGLRISALTLKCAPCLPQHWQQAEVTLLRNGRTMRFIVFRGDATAARQATSHLGAAVLPVGQALKWTELTVDSCFVIPIGLSAAPKAEPLVDTLVQPVPG